MEGLCTVNGGIILKFDEIENIGDLLGINIEFNRWNVDIKSQCGSFILMFFRFEGDDRFSSKVNWTNNYSNEDLT